MKLSGSLYQIIRSENAEQAAKYLIELNPEDIIYKGHFPGFPVTPGVIQVKIVEELLSKSCGQQYRLSAIQQSKFLKVIDPIKDPMVEIEVLYQNKAENDFLTQAQFLQNGVIVFKLKAVFTVISNRSHSALT